MVVEMTKAKETCLPDELPASGPTTRSGNIRADAVLMGVGLISCAGWEKKMTEETATSEDCNP